VLGIVIGRVARPGGPNGVAILLPLTFTMSPTSAIIMLSCIYWGSLFAGAITSVLFNIPGETHSWPQPSTVIRWRSRDVPERRSPRHSPDPFSVPWWRCC